MKLWYTKGFIENYSNKKSYFITEGLAGYSFLEYPNSDYTRMTDIYGGGDFSFALKFISSIETILAKIKSKIKESNALTNYFCIL